MQYARRLLLVRRSRSHELSYNYCNLDKVEYSGTDITSVSDDVLSEAGIIQK